MHARNALTLLPLPLLTESRGRYASSATHDPDKADADTSGLLLLCVLQSLSDGGVDILVSDGQYWS